MSNVLNCGRYFLLGGPRGGLVFAFHTQTLARFFVCNDYINIASLSPKPSCSFDFCLCFQPHSLGEGNYISL